MKFDIESSFKGLNISGEGQEYIFTTKLFSHSSQLRDKRFNIVATLSRTSWWRMNFDLMIGNKSYQLKQRALETKLYSKEGNVYFTDISGTSFLRESKPVTELTNKDLRAKEFSLSISEKDHWLALLVATCLQCNMVSANG